MSDPHETSDGPRSPVADADAHARRKRKRLYGLVAVVAFVAFGVFFFGPRVPREVHLRFDLPPTVRSDFVAIPRERVALVVATIADRRGERVAVVSLPSPRGLVGPRTAPAVLSLRRDDYLVRARIKGLDATEITLEGRFTPEDTEVVVDLR